MIRLGRVAAHLGGAARSPWDEPYILRSAIVASRVASRSACIRAEAAGHLTPLRRGGTGPVAYFAEQAHRWVRGEVPGVSTAAPLPARPLPPTALRRHPADTASAAALARIDEIARGGRR